ncbi:putative terminase large subunit [Alteromonas phage vB_AmeP_R8W]|uniref:Putative terminase large subunit n=1 Tax=Alteromonas phage vB_AmeP_R8W TaxID=2774152 RepID=A0A8E4RFZ2_9CAUD|nr:putative terminase large subunit [Alteromonas phage vB_AmeP_R8W]
MDFSSLTYNELIERVGREYADAIMAQREQDDLLDAPEGEFTDDEWAHVLESRPELENLNIDESDTFTLMANDLQYMSSLSDVEQECVRRWAEIEALRDHYALFEDFLYDCMTELMGFKCTELQIDIGRFLQSDIQHGMIQAQRSQAKSTIVAMFAVWQLIHDCKHRVLIISAGSEVAAEIANWVIQIIMNWDILECMRPDRQHGDRASSKAFDIHWQLKGAEKSPSIACIGITANMQGRRADLLIPDDIESSKNGTTEVQRQALEHLSKDFTSICQKGRIMYLGTPQTVDSIYNNLPARGYTIRVWTGRVPTNEEAKFYGDTLAPYIRKMMDDPKNQIGGGVDGGRGVPTDPVLLDEEALTKKELDQGSAYFNLQHMLNTEMSDENRHPLKAKNLIVMPFGIDKGAGEITWMPSPEKLIKSDGKFTSKPQFYRPFTVSTELYEYEGKVMYVDTAGGGKNGDETVASVTYFLHGYIFLAEILKLPGGYDNTYYEALSKLAIKHKVNHIQVEKNFGNGAFAAAWRPVMMRMYKDAGMDYTPQVEDVWESGQKELRIIDTLEPVMGRHRLIVHEDIIDYDVESVARHPIDQRETYKLFHQMQKISIERGALIHDDSIDSVAGAVRYWIDRIAVDEKVRMEQKQTDENIEFFKEWGADIGGFSNGVLGLSSDRFTKTAKQNYSRRKRR